MLPCATKVVTWNKNINKQINVATQSNGYHMMKKHTITHVPRRPYYADHIPNTYHPDHTSYKSWSRHVSFTIHY